MRRTLTTRTVGLTILMLIFATQIAFEPLSEFAIGIVGSIHKSSMNQFLIISTKFVSYAVLFGCLGLFVLQILYVAPHALENASSLTFLCMTIYLNSTLKLVFGELRPFMYSILKSLSVEMYDCETDFGMPSGHVFFGVCFYYLLRVAIFEEMENLDIPQNVTNESRRSFVRHLVNFTATKQKLGQARFRFFVFEIKKHTFNFVLITYIILLAIARVLAASHFTLQVLFGFMTGFSWGWIYFAYLRQPIRNFVHEILAVPSSRPKTRRLVNMITVVFLVITLILFFVRRLLRNEAQRAILAYFLKVKCHSHMILENKNLLDSMLILLPALIFNFYSLMPPKKFVNAPTDLRPEFWSLTKANKLLRFVVFMLPISLIVIVKVLLDKVIKSYYTYATILDYLNMAFFLTLLAFLYAVLLPLILDRLNLLLKNEFIEDGNGSDSLYLIQDEAEDSNPLHGNRNSNLNEFLRNNSNGGDASSRNTDPLAEQLDGRSVRTSNLLDLTSVPLDNGFINDQTGIEEPSEGEIREWKRDN
jgi:hypothetical protein